jgi:hypothetical protein
MALAGAWPSPCDAASFRRLPARYCVQLKLIFTNPTLVVALHLAAVLDRALPSAPLICTVLLLVVLAIISCIVYYVCADGSGERVPFTKSLGLARSGR